MEDFGEKIYTALEGNEKNINDLIGQEMNLVVLALAMIDNPKLEENVNYIFQKIYLRTSKTIEQLFLNLSANTLTDKENESLKTQIQLFINQLIEQKKIDLQDTIRWLKKIA